MMLAGHTLHGHSDTNPQTTQNNTITVKGSCGRNLHRLIIIQDFVRHIFVNMLENPTAYFRVAVAQAYDTSLGKIHTWTVRTAIKAGMYTLPTTEQFLKSINETRMLVCMLVVQIGCAPLLHVYSVNTQRRVVLPRQSGWWSLQPQ